MDRERDILKKVKEGTLRTENFEGGGVKRGRDHWERSRGERDR